jgi:hypothetical protein
MSSISTFWNTPTSTIRTNRNWTLGGGVRRLRAEAAAGVPLMRGYTQRLTVRGVGACVRVGRVGCAPYPSVTIGVTVAVPRVAASRLVSIASCCRVVIACVVG